MASNFKDVTDLKRAFDELTATSDANLTARTGEISGSLGPNGVDKR
jgi:ABC-type branched-subunit amino acid transport system ATPase component